MTESLDQQRLRARFTEDAERYDRARPGYPEALFDDLATLAGLSAGSRVLEVGCGTGQATLPLARRGYHVVAVELGEAMASLARRKLAGYPNVEVHVAAFEDWPLPAEPFDLVFGATSLHWVDPGVRWTKAAEALRPGGAVAIGDTRHVAGGTLDFFEAVQLPCYGEFMGADYETLPDPLTLPPTTLGIEASPLFAPTEVRTYTREQPYTTAEYLDVLLTYSGHRDLEPDRLEGLLGCIASLIDGQHGGAIVKAYRNDLVVARKLEG